MAMYSPLSPMQTLREALQWASSLLSSKDLNPKIAQWVLMDLLHLDLTQLTFRLDDPLPPKTREAFQEKIERIASGEPYQYVLGKADFYGRPFRVTPAVLIPRPETELLVEETLKAIRRLPGRTPLRVVDVGTGSGAIAITLALELGSSSFPRPVQVYGLDISAEALEVARHNARALKADVTFWASDLLSRYIGEGLKAEVIVSNPPYIPFSQRDKLDPQVAAYEPHLALFAEEGGLFFYRAIVEQAQRVFTRPALLAFEVGAGQAKDVRRIILQAYPQACIHIRKDYQGHERVVLAFLD